MITLRKANERGHFEHGWLDTYHTFSFADYHDPNYMGFRALRVINEDRVAAGQGFGTHPHSDMEILTYVIDGELAHKDSMGNGSTIRTGKVQGMSAGTGITHSEFNPSKDHATHLLQIWIKPNARGVKPAYGEWQSAGEEKTGWSLAASEKGEKGSISIHQDAKMYISKPKAGMELPLPIAPHRFGWIQVAKGSVELAGQELYQGDGAAFEGGDADVLTVRSDSEILLFDLV